MLVKALDSADVKTFALSLCAIGNFVTKELSGDEESRVLESLGRSILIIPTHIEPARRQK